MDFKFTDERNAITEAVARVFEDLCSDEQIKALGRDPIAEHAELWQQLAESGMLGLAIDEQYGGMGLSMLDLAGVLEQQGRHVAPVPLFSTLVECAMTIADSDNENLKSSVLPQVVSGEMTLSALRPYAGVQPTQILQVTAIEGEAIKLNGRTGLSLYLPSANGLVVEVADKDEQKYLVYVDSSTDGVSIQPQVAVSGEPAGYAIFNDVEVSFDQLIAQGDKADELAALQKHRSWIALAAIQTGVLDEGLKRAAAYVSERKQFGRPLGAFQAVSQQAANAYMDNEALRGAYWRALDYLEQGEDFGQAAAVAKYWVAKSGHKAAHTFLHLHGGMGQDLEYPIHRFFLWAKFCERYLGSADDLILDIGDKVIETARVEITRVS